MKAPLCAELKRVLCRPAAVRVLLSLVAGLAVPALPAQGAQASTQFDVIIKLGPAATQPQTGLCSTTTTSSPTATPIIVCDLKASLTPIPARRLRAYQGGGYSFISYITGPAGSVDIYTSAGTSTAFRLVNWADHEYIEMTVGW